MVFLHENQEFMVIEGTVFKFFPITDLNGVVFSPNSLKEVQ